MKIHKNDNVIVIAGKDKGKKGKVIRAYPKDETVVVEKVNIVTKHMKKTESGQGQIVKYEGPIHVSNVMLVDPGSGKPSRIGYKLEGKNKIRIAKKSGTIL